MSKDSYPALNAKQVIKLLKKAGYCFVRQSGSHAIYEKEVNGKICAVVVPIHVKKDLKSGTLKNIITQSGMTKKEFYGYLGLTFALLSGLERIMFFWTN